MKIKHPKFKDIVNTELRPIYYYAFHTLVGNEEGIHYFLLKQTHTRRELHRTLIWLYGAHLWVVFTCASSHLGLHF